MFAYDGSQLGGILLHWHGKPNMFTKTCTNAIRGNIEDSLWLRGLSDSTFALLLDGLAPAWEPLSHLARLLRIPVNPSRENVRDSNEIGLKLPISDRPALYIRLPPQAHQLPAPWREKRPRPVSRAARRAQFQPRLQSPFRQY